jgi:hypothetical protein
MWNLYFNNLYPTGRLRCRSAAARPHDIQILHRWHELQNQMFRPALAAFAPWGVPRTTMTRASRMRGFTAIVCASPYRCLFTSCLLVETCSRRLTVSGIWFQEETDAMMAWDPNKNRMNTGTLGNPAHTNHPTAFCKLNALAVMHSHTCQSQKGSLMEQHFTT